MTRPIYLLIFYVFLSTSSVLAASKEPNPASAIGIDDEYDRYKKKGDDLFKEGKYAEARRQYQNCLEVPGFESDPYALEQIQKCTTGLTLHQQVTDAFAAKNNRAALQALNQLLSLNQDDLITKNQLADYYEREGNLFFNQKSYQNARESYTQALKYSTTRQETLRLQIRNIDSMLKPSAHTGLKVAVGAVAIGAGIYAVLLRNDYQSKIGTLSQVSQTLDPTGSGTIASPTAYQQYLDAYTAAESAQQKNGLYKACIGVAAVATVAELYLLIRKPKKPARATGLHWQPSSQSLGVAATITF